MLSCWRWHSDKRSWWEPMLVSPGNDFFLALQKPVERTAGAHQLQHECSECKGWGRRTSLKKKKHFSLEVWCLFESLLPPCVIYECNLKYHFVFVRPHCYDPWSNATFDFRPPDQTQTKIKTECVKLYTHTTCHFCPQAFIDHFSSFRLSKQLILKKIYPSSHVGLNLDISRQSHDALKAVLVVLNAFHLQR